MKKYANKYAKNYLIAKAAYEAVCETEKEMEIKFLKEKGREENSIYMVDDEETFNSLNEEFGKLVESAGVQADRFAALETKKAAEDELIKFALTILPSKEKLILEQAAITNYSTREKIIEAALKYDPSL